MAEYNGAYEKQPYDVVNREDTRLSKASAKDVRLKRKIRRMRVVHRSVNLITSAIVLGIMLNTYITFRDNRTQVVNGQTIPIYPTDPITWPTYMMIATGAVSLIFNIFIIIGYARSVETANRVNTYQGYWSYLVTAINVVVWLATSTTFRMLQGDPSEVPPPRDIWGWTCSDAASNLQAEFNTKVNFDLQCNTQQVSFAMGIVNAGVEIFGFAISALALKRMMNKRRLKRIEEELNHQ